MLARCPVCGLSYFRESGYYVGGMIVTYGITIVVLTILYFALLPFPDAHRLTADEKLGLWVVVAVILSLAFVRYGYSLWLSIDYWIEPWEPEA